MSSQERSRGYRRKLLLALGLLSGTASLYLLASLIYWPALRPATGVRQPLHYNESYVWPRPWTLSQAAPPASDPTPVAVLWGDNAVSQSFTASADNLAMLRVWLAPTRGAPTVRVSLMAGASGGPAWADPLYEGELRLQPRGRYYAFAFPPIPDARGRRFLLRLEATDVTADAPVAVRVGYVDAVGGLLYLNEYRAAGDLDFGIYHRGWPGLWTLRVLGERILPRMMVARLSQYKPAWAKGAAFGLSAAALGLGCAALLWLMWPGQVHGHATIGVAATLLTTFLLVSWREVGASLGLSERRARLHVAEARAERPALVGRALLTHDLLIGLEFAARDPEPRLFRGDWTSPGEGDGWPSILAPGSSRASFRMDVPPDTELRFRYARIAGTGALAIQVAGNTAWEAMTPGPRWQEAAVDLRPWAGQAVRVSLMAEGGGQVLWGDPQVISARTWVQARPFSPKEGILPVRARFGHDNASSIELAAYSLEPGTGSLAVTLYWSALQPISEDYTVFVHALDEAGQMTGQSDARPVSGAYPSYLWPPDHIVIDRHVVPVDGPVRQLAVGLYEWPAVERLDAWQGDGAPWANGQVLLAVDSQPSSQH